MSVGPYGHAAESGEALVSVSSSSDFFGGEIATRRRKAQSLVEALPKYLTWQTGHGLIDQTGELYDAWIAWRLHAWKETDYAGIVEQLLSLPEIAQTRLFRAPHFFYLLRSKKVPTQNEWILAASFLNVERYLLGDADAAPEGAWSARGDFCIPPKSRASCPQILSAPAAVIALDTQSPFLRKGWLSPELGEPSRYDDREAEEHRSRLETNLHTMSVTNPTAYHMVSNSIRAFATAKSLEAPDLKVSMSARRTIGLVTLSNLHSSCWTEELLSEALVHEALHSVIYRLELFRSLYLDDRASFTQHVTSPWSGRSLELHSFVHACFVWYGIWNFWRLNVPESPSSLAQLVRARDGFMRVDMDELLSTEVSPYTESFVVDAVSEMSASVADAC